jgi:glycosyltransferase involved in cell wall biosynthesis
MSTAQLVKSGFTVLMAVYQKDNVGLFEKAVTSIYQNSLLPDDFILVVDGPVPDTLGQKINQLSHQHPMRVIWLPENQGLANALNEGLKRIQTTWVMRADADDINLPNRFEKLIKNSGDNVDIVGSAIRENDKNGKYTGSRSVPLSHLEICEYAKRRNPFNHMAVMFRKDLVVRNMGYPNLYLREDYALWAVLLSGGARALNLPDELVEAYAGDALIQRRGGFKYAMAEVKLQIFLVRYGIKSPLLACIDTLLRGGIFCLPWYLRAKIYQATLRKPLTIKK